MSQNNDSANYTSDSAQREHKEEENSRFGRGRRGTQEENSQDQGQKTNNSKGSNKDSNKSDSGSEKNNQTNQQNSETPQENSAPSESQNQDQTSNNDVNEDQNNDSNENDDAQSNDGRRRDDKSDDGRGREDQSDDGRGRDNNSDGRSEQGEFDEIEEEEEYEEEEEKDCDRPEPDENEEECEPHNPELDQQGNSNHPNGPNHDDSDHSDHGGPGHHLPPGGPESQAPSYRPGFMERTSAYTLTFSSETMFEVLLGSLLILVSAVFLFIYLVKRQRRKTMRSHSPVQFVTPNQNIATSNFYQYYQKEGLIPTGTVVGYIPEGQFLQPGAKNVQNLKSFGRMPTQDEILDLS